MSQPVRIDHSDAVTVITLDNPPVNVMSFDPRVALRDALTAGMDDPAVETFVISGACELALGCHG